MFYKHKDVKEDNKGLKVGDFYEGSQIKGIRYHKSNKEYYYKLVTENEIGTFFMRKKEGDDEYLAY